MIAPHPTTLKSPRAWVLLLLTVIGAVYGLRAEPAGPGRLQVFVLAGQSNLEGQGVADLAGKDYNDGKGTLAKLLRDPAKAPR